MDTTFIYALKDPENGEIRYVGKSDNPKKRLCCHLTRSNEKCHRASWIKSLASRELKPALEIIDEVPKSEWPQWEVAYIEFFLEQGCELVNGTPGGDCGPSTLGKKHTKEWRAAHSARMSGEKNPFFGRKHSPESRKKQSEEKSGEKHPFFGKIGAQHPAFGLKPTPEKTAKVSQKLKGRKRPSDFSETLSKARIGLKLRGARSEYSGVSWKTECGKWTARIKVTGKRIYLGIFENEIEAAEVYDIAAKIHHGTHAVLNFPD